MCTSATFLELSYISLSHVTSKSGKMHITVMLPKISMSFMWYWNITMPQQFNNQFRFSRFQNCTVTCLRDLRGTCYCINVNEFVVVTMAWFWANKMVYCAASQTCLILQIFKPGNVRICVWKGPMPRLLVQWSIFVLRDWWPYIVTLPVPYK